MSDSPTGVRIEHPGTDLHVKVERLCLVCSTGVSVLEPTIGEACSAFSVMIARVTSILPDEEFEKLVGALPGTIRGNRELLKMQRLLMTEVQGNG